ncbi:hypothetical protein ACFC00_19485 [Streptomyces adustus]
MTPPPLHPPLIGHNIGLYNANTVRSACLWLALLDASPRGGQLPLPAR